MRPSFRNCLFALIATALLLSPGCASPRAADAPSPGEIIDQLGRTVKLDKVPQRIVSLAPSNTEILFALGLANRIVGVTDYCNYPPEAKQKPSIGGFSTPNIERLVAQAPDLVLATSIHQKTVIPRLEEQGITVFALASKTLDETMESIILVGKITGSMENTSELIAQMQKRIKAITDKTQSIPEDKRPGVFYLTWHDPLKTSGVGTLHDELIKRAGGRNIFQEVAGTQSVDLELLVARNPQVMIAGVGMGTGEDLTFQYLKADKRLLNTEAGKSGRIYKINMDLSGRAGPRLVEGLEQFARCIYPEIFGPPEDN